MVGEGVGVRAVQSSQNPGDAPGRGRAAVGETPRDSRIRACRRKGQSAGAFRLEGRWPALFSLTLRVDSYRSGRARIRLDPGVERRTIRSRF